jgi:hypothetical protein
LYCIVLFSAYVARLPTAWLPSQGAVCSPVPEQAQLYLLMCGSLYASHHTHVFRLYSKYSLLLFFLCCRLCFSVHVLCLIIFIMLSVAFEILFDMYCFLFSLVIVCYKALCSVDVINCLFACCRVGDSAVFCTGGVVLLDGLYFW